MKPKPEKGASQVAPDQSQAEQQKPAEKLRKTEGASVNGDITLYYPSGQIAVVVTRSLEMGFRMVYLDSDAKTVVVCFDSNGVGSACFPTGAPWLSTTESGYVISGAGGDIVEQGKWPRPADKPAVSMQLTESVFVRFKDRQDIELRFNTEDIPERSIQLGQELKRTTTYLSLKKGSEIGELKGKVKLDVERIRRNFATHGHLYGKPGPHSYVSQRPGLGNLSATIKRLDATCRVMPIVDDLGETQRRLRLINTMPVPLHGTLGRAKGTERLVDFGEAPMSETGRKLMRRRAAPAHMSTRGRVPNISLKTFKEEVIGPARSDSKLYVVCCHATWNYGPCRKALNLLGDLVHIVQSGQMPVAQEFGLEVQPYAMEISEGNFIYQTYGIRMMPFFLVFRSGRLVDATNDVSTKSEIVGMVTAALRKAAKDQYLPEGFAFSGSKDNVLLDRVAAHGLALSAD